MVQMPCLASTEPIAAGGTDVLSTAREPRNPRAPHEQQGWTIAVRDWCAVMRFMDRYPFLRPIVQAAYAKIPIYFARVDVTVGVVDDPAAPGNDHLTLALAVSDGHDEAARRFADFGKEWLHNALCRAQGKMSVVLLPGSGPADALV